MKNIEEKVENLSELCLQLADAHESLLARHHFTEGRLVAIQSALRSLTHSAINRLVAEARVAEDLAHLSSLSLHSLNTDEFIRGIELVKEMFAPASENNRLSEPPQ